MNGGDSQLLLLHLDVDCLETHVDPKADHDGEGQGEEIGHEEEAAYGEGPLGPPM